MCVDFLSYHLVSHMVIEEVNCIQNHLEIEKTCRESAEALATKVRRMTAFELILIFFFYVERIKSGDKSPGKHNRCLFAFC